MGNEDAFKIHKDTFQQWVEVSETLTPHRKQDGIEESKDAPAEAPANLDNFSAPDQIQPHDQIGLDEHYMSDVENVASDQDDSFDKTFEEQERNETDEESIKEQMVKLETVNMAKKREVCLEQKVIDKVV